MIDLQFNEGFDVEEFPNELWMVCFVKDGKKIFRKLWSKGYYEAFNKVLDYAKRRRLDVLWIKEGILCKDIICKELEVFCVYCNNMIEESYSIECSCKAVLCSRQCYNAHRLFRHICP